MNHDPGPVFAVIMMSSILKYFTSETFLIPAFFHFVFYKDPKEYKNQKKKIFELIEYSKR